MIDRVTAGCLSPRLPLALVAALVLAAPACTSNGEARQEPDPALLALVDSVMPGLERLSGLARRAPVQTALQSRDDARAFIVRQLERELPPERLTGMRASYAALGLLPDTIDLRSLMEELYAEQVVGYYDPETERLYVVEGVDRTALRPVLAHELVHALQDQHVNLDSLVAREVGNDRQTAAQAAVEGHATLVMLAFLAEQMSGQEMDPLAMPNPALQLAPALQAQNSQFPVFQRAPAVIRESMLFPYVSGAGFVHTVWQARGRASFTDLIPESTEQVMHPETRYLEPDSPSDLAYEQVPTGWTVLYENTLGEFETKLWLREHLGITASAAAAGWDGDRYRLLASAAGDTALVWWSVWDDEAAAAAFAAAAARVQPDGRLIAVDRQVVGDRPFVVVTAGRGDATVPVAPPHIVH